MTEPLDGPGATASPPPNTSSRKPSIPDLKERTLRGWPRRPENSESPQPSGSLRRRSSLISFSSLDDMTSRLTDDIINPSMRRAAMANEAEQVTHWHSTPLAFAMLPAVGGLLFQNGSAFMTDALLLGLAAVFLNWSIRLPWDWYYSAQEQRREAEPDYFNQSDGFRDSDVAVESSSSMAGSPTLSAHDDSPLESVRPNMNTERDVALAELRRLEIIALLSTFIAPVLTAYLLHVIRGQLSNASTTKLVSDYNLGVFLLAAEIRPFRQLMRLISKRTMHLQRTVASSDDSFRSSAEGRNTISNLTSRIAELENKLAGNTLVSPSDVMAQKSDVSDLVAEMRKRYEPRLDGLERAVRRYEKRSTTLAMLIEQRLAQLEMRLQDALSLAAVAAQHSHRGTAGKLADSIVSLLIWPFQLARAIIVSPLGLVGDVYAKTRTLLFGPSRTQTSKRDGARHGHGSKPTRMRDELGPKKQSR